MSKRRNNINVYSVLIVVFIAIIITASHVLTVLYLASNNTLQNNRHWISTKPLLGRAVMGAYGFICLPQALNKNNLNLGAWHGFQEVFYFKSLDITNVRFDFKLEQDAYLTFIFNKHEDGFSGIRFSANERFPSCVVTATAEGEFLTKQELTPTLVAAGGWHQAHIALTKDAVGVFIDNTLIKTINMPVIPRQSIGFRGSRAEAYIDTILAYDVNGTVIMKETFTNRRGYVLVFFTIMAMCIILAMLTIIIMRKKQCHVNIILYSLMMGGCTMLIISLILLYFSSYYFGRYASMTSNHLKEAEEYWRKSEKQVICDDIASTYGTKHPGCTRMLFIGTSQTWGAGAAEYDNSFVSMIEATLNADNDNKFECINGSISGANAKELFELYENEWLRLRPDVVVINLSTNDCAFGPKFFAEYLERFALLNKKEGIATVFILEPNSSELYPDSLPLHHVMRYVGTYYDVPVIDLHSYLTEKHDGGFLWWDMCHLTSFGQSLSARYIAGQLSEIISLDKKTVGGDRRESE